MADNYTPIPVNSQATSDLFNDVFDEFDDALGDVGTLATTATDLTGGVNELRTRLVVSTDSDGTLKAGAVDVAAVLADNVVTTAKILDANVTAAKIAAAVAGDGLAGGAGTALSVNVDGSTLEISSDSLRVKAAGITPAKLSSAAFLPTNRHPDPFNQIFVPGETAGNRTRFISPSNLSLAASASPNPYTTQALRIGNALSFGGPVVWMDEAGFKEGDTLSIQVELSGASGSCNLTYRFFTSAGAGIGVQVSTSSVAFTGALQSISVTGITVPATAAFLGIYPIRVTGSANIDIYSTTVVHGSDLPGVVRPSAVAPAVWDEFLAARGTEATIDDRFVSLETGAVVSFPANQDVYGRFYLRDWSAQIAKIQQAGSGEQGDIALIGDSWVQNDLIGNPTRTALQTLYGAGGAGYIGIGNDHGEPTLTGTSYNRTGTWTDRDNFPAPVGYGIDIADATTTDLTATVVITSIATDFTIHYIKQVNGGSFRHKIDAGGYTTVNTANASTIHATEAITGLSNASHTLTIEITVAGVAGVTMLGVDARITGTNAVRLHRIGNGGATIAQYVSADATIWQAALTAIAPNLAIILLGTNDDSANIVPATFATNLTTLITRIRTAMPLCDVLLLTPTANGLTPGTYGMSDYVAQIRSVAVANDCMCLDMYMSIDDYTDGDARGLFADTAHLNAYGGQIVANRLVRELVVD